MNFFIRLLVATIAFTSCPSATSAQRAVYLVRHAQKTQQGDALTERGKAQAEMLARILADTGITTVYTSQFDRTKQTAKPLESLLKARGIEVREDEIHLANALVKQPDDRLVIETYAKDAVVKFRREANEKIILVVGHDNTVPAIIKALGCESDVEIKRDEFVHLFVVIPGVEGKSTSGLFHVPDYILMQPKPLTPKAKVDPIRPPLGWATPQGNPTQLPWSNCVPSSLTWAAVTRRSGCCFQLRLVCATVDETIHESYTNSLPRSKSGDRP